ncbi:MAG: penicillin-binding protein 2, partial [Bacteroidia bacterium]
MQSKHTDRMYVLMVIVVLISITFLGRLFYIQVLDDSYQLSAENNVLRYETQFPARGLMYDRDGRLLVYNEAAYDLMVIPRQAKDIDTTAICNVLEISKETFIKKLNKAKAYSWRKPSIFEKQISAQTYANLQEKLYRLSGFFVQKRTLRKYPEPIAAHLLG